MKVAGGFAVSSLKSKEQGGLIRSPEELQTSWKYPNLLTSSSCRAPFLQDNIFPTLQSDPCHAEEVCDDADGGQPAA